MLSTYIKTGVKILGLQELVGSAKPAFEGCYRIVNVGATTAIEFFDKAQRTDQSGMHSIGILPYQTNKIAEMSLNHSEEVISGEFTGCVMGLYKKGGVLTAGHVDTNKDTSKRGVYNNLKDTGAIKIVKEIDTTGMLQKPGTIAICIASKNSIESYIVSKESHYSHQTKPLAGVPGQTIAGQTASPIYTVL